MWTWVAHRITGVAVFFFLLVHRSGPSRWSGVSPMPATGSSPPTKTPDVNLLEVGLVGASWVPRSTASRIILEGPRLQRQMTWESWRFGSVLMILGAYCMPSTPSRVRIGEHLMRRRH